jgi:hypothetical protein
MGSQSLKCFHTFLHKKVKFIFGAKKCLLRKKGDTWLNKNWFNALIARIEKIFRI